MKRLLTILLILSVAMPALAIWPFKTTKPVKDTDTVHIYNPKLPDDNVKTRERQDDSEKVNVENLEKLADLADKLKVAPAALVKKLFMQGKMVTVNEEIDYDTAEEIALEYEVRNATQGTLSLTARTEHCFTTPDLRPERHKKACPELYELYLKYMQE